MGAHVIKESRLRWAGIVPLPDGTRIFLKRDRSKGWFEYAKYLLLPSKGRKEWLTASQLRERNVNIPGPLGWTERRKHGLVRESYYISEAVGSGVPYLEDAGPFVNVDAIIALARTARKIHDAGLFHKDFHGGNFLWDGESLFLTDLHGGRIVGTVSLNQRLWMISHLFHSLRSRWGEKDQWQFVTTYFQGEPLSEQEKEECVQRIHRWMDRLKKRQWRSRTKRCLKESTEFTIDKERGGAYYHRRDVPLEQLKRLVEEHRRVVGEESSDVLKDSASVTVTRVTDGTCKVCVKHFHPHRLGTRVKEYFRRSKGFKAWISGNGVRVRGVPCVKPLALVEARPRPGQRENFFLMEAMESGRELDRYLVKGFEDFRRKRVFIKAFAQWLSHLHEKGIYHLDMKTCNIWVSEEKEGWEFRLLDLEDVRLDETVDGKKLFMTFLQLNASIPGVIPRRDRLRFLRHYLSHRSIDVDRKRWLKWIEEETRRRGIVYVAPWGVVKDQ